ncbi:hypothetical protein ER308_13095 [Egibacter rhizosphaerae]|uniref:IacB protein n=1 Tax=Egibacter rhizosphaerae TaxID=1670831 RepID=A0A411YGY4_9ACTN|nr:hypothetical protein [Egibacter rhizosphaerae]QBI20409.1 hypothetical protein ER308_13095 [Egibacter rhizosphaerae]
MSDDQQSYRDKGPALRVLFCIGVQQPLFEEPAAKIPELIPQIADAFADLGGRFGITVLGTMDDDELMVGSSPTWPWTAYILADAPSLEAVTGVCNIVRDGEIDEYRLWRYLKIEARVGRQLFFGNE